jgi:lipid-A-disaccharide synthase
LVRLVRPSVSREEFFSSQGLAPDRPLITLLPGSRRGEALRHMPALMDAVERLERRQDFQFLLALPSGFWEDGGAVLKRRIGGLPVRIVEGRTWDAMAYAELALAASGTVTVEAALLGVPMVTFYRVTGLSWHLGRFLVDVPFYSMVNLVAGRTVVPELIQNEMSGERLALEALRLLEDSARRERMREDLSTVAAQLAGESDPFERAAQIVRQVLRLDQGVTHVA